MPFHDTLMMALATWVYRREVDRRRILQGHIQATFRQMDRLYMREPAGERRQEQYWAYWIGLRCFLIETQADELVSEVWFAWAQAYLTVRPIVQYV